MEFQTLLGLFDGSDPVLSTELLGEIRVLLERKAVTDEKALNPQMPLIIDFIREECSRQKILAETLPDDHKRDFTEINQTFRRALNVLTGQQ